MIRICDWLLTQLGLDMVGYCAVRHGAAPPLARTALSYMPGEAQAFLVPICPSRATLDGMAEALVQRVSWPALLDALSCAASRRAQAYQAAYPGAAYVWRHEAARLCRLARRADRQRHILG